MAEEEEAKQDEEEPKKSSSKLIIIIVVLVVLIGGGVGAFFAFSGGGESAEVEEVKEEEDEVAGLPGAVYPLETFIVNLSVKGSFLKAAIQLEFYEPEFPPTVDMMIPRIRDAIIQILSSKTSSDILGTEGKEKLREEIINAVNETLGSEEVAQVYFTEFIVQ